MRTGMRLVSYAKLGLVLVALLMLCAASAAHADPGSVASQPGAAAPESATAEGVSGANAPGDTSGDTSVTMPGDAGVPSTPGDTGTSQGTPVPPSSNQPTDPPTVPTSGPQTTNQPPSASTAPATPVDESSQSSATANQTLPSGSDPSADGQDAAASDPPPTVPLPSTDSGGPQVTPGEPNTTSQVPAEPNTTTQVPAEPNTTTQVPAEPNTTTQVPAEPNTTTQVPAESNTTTQVILQIQLAGCTIHCNGTSQTQVASQLNTTVQAIGDLTPISANSTPQTGADDGEAAISSGTLASSGGIPQITSAGLGISPPITSSISQTQLGCLQFCFGSTTVSTLDPQLSEDDVDQLLAELEALNSPVLDPIPALDENVVDQTSGQYQDDQSGDDELDPAGPQTQNATQINSTIQIVASSLLSDLAAAAGAGSSAAEVLNQTFQGIWQLQIGCVFDCFLTQQTQQAEQSNVTIYLQPDPPATTSTANTTMSLIWQLQVGCLFWCYDAVEVQTATSSSTTLVVVPVPPTPPVGSGGTGQPSPASTSPVSTTGVTLATTISAPPLNPIVAPPAAPTVASARSAPAPLKVALEPLNAVLSAAIAQPSHSAVSAAANHAFVLAPTAVVDPAGSSPIRRFTAHVTLHRDRGRATTNRDPGTLKTARSSVSSSGLAPLAGLAALLALLVAICLVVFGGSHANRKRS